MEKLTRQKVEYKELLEKYLAEHRSDFDIDCQAAIEAHLRHFVIWLETATDRIDTQDLREKYDNTGAHETS